MPAAEPWWTSVATWHATCGWIARKAVRRIRFFMPPWFSEDQSQPAADLPWRWRGQRFETRGPEPRCGLPGAGNFDSPLLQPGPRPATSVRPHPGSQGDSRRAGVRRLEGKQPALDILSFGPTMQCPLAERTRVEIATMAPASGGFSPRWPNCNPDLGTTDADRLERLPADSILGLAAACRADPNPDKVDLTVGIYMDGRPLPGIQAIRSAQQALVAQSHRPTCLPATAFIQGMQTLVLAGQRGPGRGAWAAMRAPAVAARCAWRGSRARRETTPTWPVHFGQRRPDLRDLSILTIRPATG